MLYVETTSNPVRVERDVKDGAVVHCPGSWTFQVPNQSSESLIFLLMKRIIFGPNRAIGRCSLPLDWFPPNRVVREWFPMTATAGGETGAVKTMLLLDVHIAERKAKRFKAPFATLRIVPTWIRPVDEGTECPAPPQVIFVLQPGEMPPGAVPCPVQQSFGEGRNAAGLYDQEYYPSVGVTPLSGGSAPYGAEFM